MGKGSKRRPPQEHGTYEDRYDQVEQYTLDRAARPGKTIYVADKNGKLVPKEEVNRIHFISVDPAGGEEIQKLREHFDFAEEHTRERHQVPKRMIDPFSNL